MTAVLQRYHLAALPTPLERLDNLAGHLGLPPGRLWVKRDDLTGLCGGGNKARKLEFLGADALARGCARLVTGGSGQSNHARLTAAAARKLGLDCTLLLVGEPGDEADGNLLLSRALGADIRWLPADTDLTSLNAAIDAVAAETGGYPISMGGATVVGGLGYFTAVSEIVDQLPDVEVVVTASGAGGTHSGLVAGFGDHGRVLGVDVGARDDLPHFVRRMAGDVAAFAGREAPTGELQLRRQHVGPGYGLADEETLEAIALVARCEGVMLDPTYTGKAMAGLLAAYDEGQLTADQTVLFLHTGGLPALLGWPERNRLLRDA